MRASSFGGYRAESNQSRHHSCFDSVRPSCSMSASSPKGSGSMSSGRLSVDKWIGRLLLGLIHGRSIWLSGGSSDGWRNPSS